MTNKQIIEAQKLLRKLEGEPVKVYNEQGTTFWQVTYENDTYCSLINILESVANTPIKEYSSYPQPTYTPYSQHVFTPDYHREKID